MLMVTDNNADVDYGTDDVDAEYDYVNRDYDG